MLASDADREHAADMLREGCAEGRISVDELDARLTRAYAATTTDELEIVLSGLPAARPAANPQPAPAFTGGQITAAVVLTILLPFGRLIALLTSASMLRTETVPARRAQLVLWARAAAALLVIEVIAVILFVVLL